MPDTVGNTFATAKTIFPIAGGQTFQEFIGVENGNLDSSDYYRFTLARSSSFNIALTGLSADANLEVLNSAGSVVIDQTGVALRFTNSGTLPEAFTTLLSAGTYYIHVFAGPPTNPANPIGTTPSTNYSLSVSANPNARSDIFWRNYGTGDNGVWFMEGTSLASFTLTTNIPANSGWQVQATGDMDGDGDGDVFWRNIQTGDNGIWIMNGASLVSAVSLPKITDFNWYVGGIGDFNKDGKNDLFWRNDALGVNGVWFMNGPVFTGSVGLIETLSNTNYKAQAIADFNNDGNPDIFYREYSGGGNLIWLMNGTTRISTVVDFPALPDVNYQVRGTGDYNLDGRPDILFRNSTTGQNLVWFLNGISFAGTASLTVAGSPWQPTAPLTRYLPPTRSDLAPNALSTPFLIGTLNGSGTYRDSIGSGDTNDYYQFFVGSGTRLQLSLTGVNGTSLTGDLDLQILDSNGAIVNINGSSLESLNLGGTPEFITANIDPGNYFIRVFSKSPSDSSLYDLSLNVNNLPVLATKTNLTINEGSTQTISSNLLLVTDENNTADQLTYTLVTPTNRGGLSLAGTAIIAGSTFTQADINAGRLSYSQDGSETLLDSFVFGVSDGAGGTINDTTFTINTVPVNDPPVLVSNQPLAVSEGTAVFLSNTSLLVTDVEQQLATQIVYTFNSLPSNGSLILNGTALSVGGSFTQADVNSGTRLRYSHNGSETLSDTFAFTVTDGAGGFLTPAVTTFSIDVAPVNDAPVLTTNLGLTVSQDATARISSTLLTATDAEFLTLPDQVVYTVVTGPTRGTLYRNGTVTTTFTQADINNGFVSYDHDGSNTNSDSFTFRVSDGVNTVPNTALPPSTFNITVNRSNFVPVLVTNAGLTVTEGTTAAISNTLLRITDQDNPPPQLVYTLLSLPTNGSLKRLGTNMTLGQTFTQDDLDQATSRISYQHNGSESPLTDSFTFTASDGSSTPIPTSTFSISVISANDAPGLATNTGASLSEGGTFLITNSVLQVTDNDNPPPASLVYSVTSAPSNGTLFLGTTAVTTFTQADINSGQLRYSHNGSESVADSFSFTVTDGVITAPIGPNVFNIAIAPVNDAPRVSLNTGLTLSEGTSSTIASTALLVTDPDGPSPVQYTLGSLPGRGVLLLGSTTLSAGQTFSQGDIANGQLSYIHNGSETTSDSFTFTASDGTPTGVLSLTTFSINVTPVNDAPVLVTNTGATLAEGGSVSITTGSLLVTDNDNPLPANLTYSVTSAPLYGTLLLGNTAVTTFTQADVNSGQLKYSHNGSETVSDSFSFTVTDGVVTTPVGPNTFNISVNPVNDAPRVSLNTGLTLSEGAASTIASTALLVTDPDGPSGVTYTLSGLPARGTLLLGATSLANGQTFTQADITSGQLSYSHNGSETTSDSFTFTASDGSTGTLPLTTFNISVTPVNDAPVLTLPDAQLVNEDTLLTFSNATRIRLSDAENDNPISVTLAVNSGVITVNSGAGVTNNNSGNVTVTGSVTAVETALNNLVYQPNANFNGPDALIISANDGTNTTNGTVNITVAAVNDAPTLTVPGAQIVNEDTPLVLTTINTTDIDSGGSPVRATLSALNGTLSLASTAGVSFINGTNGANSLTIEGSIASIQGVLSNLTYQGNPDYNGADTITVTINDQGATGSPGALGVTRTIPVTVRSVNDAPTFTGGANQAVNEDAGTQVVTGWATNILRGPANESGQTINFVVNNDNAALFTTTGQPRIDPTTGNLIYTPAANAFGTATVTVRLQDNGGTSFGGVDTSSDYTFTIDVNPVNDAPTFTRGSNITIAEDSPAQSVLWATNISPGPGTPLPPNESNQTVNFIVANDNPGLFTVGGQPTIAPNGTLNYTLAQDANGIAVVTVALRDNGGTDNGGVDTSALQTFTINVTGVNDAPTLTLPGAQTLDEDTVLGIPGVSINDVDAGTGNLRITLTALGTGSPSTGGNLSFSTTPGVTVTGNNSSSLTLTGKLADLNTALSTFSYQGRTNVNGQDRVVITVNDQGNSPSGPLSATQTLTVNVTPVNDAPILNITGGTTRTGLEDNLVTLSGISVTDVDSDPGNVQLTVSVLQGTLAATAGAQPVTIDNGGTSAITLTGTRSAVNSVLSTLRYQGIQDFNGTDTATITVSDLGNTGIGGPLTATQSLTINVTPVNDPPVFLSLPTGAVPVAEDTDLTFDSARAIVVTDVDSGLNPVRLTLSVSNGKLNLNPAGLTTISGANGSASATYEGTIDAISDALSSLIYRGNSNYNGSDRLTITLNDNGFTGAATGTPVTRTVDINVTPVSDPPVLVTNNVMTLNEGASQNLSNGLLRTTDVDTPAAQVVYTLSTGAAPAYGSLVRNGTTLAAGDTFSQDDIDRGLVRYFHNGSETTLDSFTFTVNDGGAQPTTAQFNIRVNSINDNPVLAVRQPLTVTEGLSGTISSTLLQVTDPDNTALQLRYTVTNLPTSGSVRLNGSNLSVGQTFTQNDVNLNRVTYRHNGSETASDSFTFTVSDGAGGNIGSTVFSIGVIPVNDPPQVVTNGPLTISEGAITTITQSALRTTDPESQPVTYTLVAQPLFGTVSRNGTALANGATFTQADIDTGLISYQHNGSETPNNRDSFFYTVSDGSLSTSRIFDINVTPVNDAPVLLTPNPTIEVPGDVASIVEISAGVLSVTDVDNTPDQLVYQLVSAPNVTFGRLELSGTPLISGQTFTQADIDAGRVVYRSLGGGSTDTFQISVSDGGVGGTLPTQFVTILFSYPPT